jgi:hypothetical protein
MIDASQPWGEKSVQEKKISSESPVILGHDLNLEIDDD